MERANRADGQRGASPPLVWDAAALCDPHSRADKARRVQAMFDAIAPSYERVNAIASFGQDARWRRKAVALAAPGGGDVALDICCGTGDMVRALAAHRPAPRVILGLDFAARMLGAGQYDGLAAPVQLLRADGTRLPLTDGSVDVITCAFGARNFQDIDAGLMEMRRVLRSAGRAVILEFSTPENAMARWGYRLYTETILPRVAALVSGDRSGAYRYLPRSIQTFDSRAEFAARLTRTGFPHVQTTSMNFGGVVAYLARN